MSLGISTKTLAEFEEEAFLQYKKDHGGAFLMKDLAKFLIDDGWEVKIPSEEEILTKRLNRRAREVRKIDRQGRKVRPLHAAKFERIDEKGKGRTEVRWDHIDDMSFDHALLSFKQRYENHQKQDRALRRDVGSFNDNNPNAVDRKIQLELFTMEDDASEQAVEYIDESPRSRAPRPR